MTSLKHWLRRSAKRFGVDIRKLQPFSDEFETLTFILSRLGLKTVIDVGANDGGFAGALIRAGYRDRIVSFEPLPDAHARLQLRAAGNPNWVIHPRCAIGDREGVARFYVAENSSSSSLLRMADRHTDAAPGSAMTGTIDVQVKRLDAVIRAAELNSAERLFLKIDTQGSEDLVLDGASGLMDRIVGIRTEMSLVELYRGQKLFDEMYSRIRTLGFDLWEVAPVLRDRKMGRMLQYDATFVRTTEQADMSRIANVT